MIKARGIELDNLNYTNSTALPARQPVRQQPQRPVPQSVHGRTPAAPKKKPKWSFGKSAAVKAQPAKEKKKLINWAMPQKFDFSFFLIVTILMAFGLVMLFSATYASAKFATDSHDSLYYIKRQLIFAALGFVGMIVISFIDYHVLQNKVIMRVAIVVSIGMMLFVKFAGKTTNGSERWLEIAGFTIQPSEILKFTTILVIAAYMQKNYDRIGDFWHGFVPLMLRVGAACFLVVIQPHLSATLIILTISVAMVFIGGARIPHVMLVLAGIAVAAFAVFEIFPKLGFDYVSDRMTGFLNPEADVQKATYQTYQSLIAIGSGGWFGQGLGNSHQKYSYLPFVNNDFIFAIIVEELGFAGALVVIVLFLILVIRGFYIAASAPDKFGMLLCSGIVIQIGVQALLNIAVVSNAFFNTGVSLPFISYGGTALLMQLCEMGVVLNISRKASI